jgi:hypothetical protein
MFCVAYGLSMDYEVFVLAHIKEEHDRFGDTERAVGEGVRRTAPPHCRPCRGRGRRTPPDRQAGYATSGSVQAGNAVVTSRCDPWPLERHQVIKESTALHATGLRTSARLRTRRTWG